jgi:hypothetical protein
MKKLFLLILLISLISCKKTDTGWRIIQVNSGDHYSDTYRGEIVPAKYSFLFMFEPNCIYSENYNHWNKLAGWEESDGKHSVRIGWRCSEGMLIVGYYIHSYGHIVSGELDTLQPGKAYSGRVAFEENGYTVEVNGKRFRMDQAHKPLVCWKCYPYFGGEPTAPHTMEFRIKND